jgi:2-polyprenyl-6-hydroxyphenyl methylase/3-demethylubiquinone-9 3-methyltransferase
MGQEADLTRQEEHFAFGRNWASYASGIGGEQIEAARHGLVRLTGGDLTGRRFLDIGCGSGVHALAALALGASEVVAVDIDPDSVATTKRVLAAHAPSARWSAQQISVFDMEPAMLGTFDVVYSWGVLHHTGDMNRAQRKAAALVAERGQFVFALYQRTLCCDLWKVEKRWYAHADVAAQRRAEKAYVQAFRAGLALTGRSLSGYVAGYKSKRGMDFQHDVRDWLGGWPYESISAAGVDRLMREFGLARTAFFGKRGIGFGALGVGCNEYVYARGSR